MAANRSHRSTRRAALLILAALLPGAARGFYARSPRRSALPLAAAAGGPIPAAGPDSVTVLPDAASVAQALRDAIDEAAEEAIAARGRFALAIPGGSVLKMLSGAGTPWWASRTTLAYVNIKCVPNDDMAASTHAKAGPLFLDAWKGVDVVTPTGSADAAHEAAQYAGRLAALGPDALPKDPASGMPVFDLMAIGVGDDGHVGSLYPGRDEVLDEQSVVVPVAMKDPPSISLSMPTMRAARRVVIAALGVSEKYASGKSEAMRRAIEAPEETLVTFPAAGLRGVATYLLDEGAAADLSERYTAWAPTSGGDFSALVELAEDL